MMEHQLPRLPHNGQVVHSSRIGMNILRAKINDARWYIRARILKGTHIMAVLSRGKLSGDICVFQVDRNNVNCRYWQIMTFF